MKAIPTLLLTGIAALGLGAAAPAEARDHHNGGGHYYHNGGRYYGGHYRTYGRAYYGRPYYNPYYYGYRAPVIYDDPYYYDGYTPRYRYYSGPTLSFSFGGSRYHNYHHHH